MLALCAGADGVGLASEESGWMPRRGFVMVASYDYRWKRLVVYLRELLDWWLRTSVGTKVSGVVVG